MGDISSLVSRSKNNMNERVVVLGASSKPERYSYRAVELLTKHNHSPLPVSLKGENILGHKGYKEISEIEGAVDTVTLYVNPRILSESVDDIIALKPKRVIMNPGTESAEAADQFEKNGIRVIQACTLVLLTTQQYLSV